MCGQLTPEPELQARTERAPHRAPADGPPPDRPVTRGVYDGDRQAAPASPPRPPSRCRSLAARLQVTTQPPPPQPPPSPRARPARPLCVRHRILRRPSGKAPRPPARRRVPPRGGRRRRSPKVPRPPAAAASRTPRPGLLVQPQLRLLGRRRHLSLCGKTRPSGWSGASLGRSSPGPGAAGRVPPQLRPPPSAPPPPEPGRPGRSRGRRQPDPRRPPETHSLVPCASNRGDVGSARRPRVTRRSHGTLLGSNGPRRSPLFAGGLGAHGAGARLSRLCLAAGRRGRPARSRAQRSAALAAERGARAPWSCVRACVPERPGQRDLRGGTAGTVPPLFSGAQKNQTRSPPPSGDLSTPKEVPAPK